MARPPRVAEWLLLRVVRGRDGAVIAGDLDEEYQIRGGGAAWYWMQVASCILVRLSPHRRWIPDIGHDFHYALRIIRRNPGYAIASALCLALGIGVNASVFSLLDGMFLRRLPVPDSARVVAIDRERAAACGIMEFVDFKPQLRAFSDVAAVIPRSTYLDVEQANDQIYIETVTANYANVLQTKPALGRWFIPSDERPGGGMPVVISDRIWDRHFGRDPNVAGRSIRIENQVYEVVGVSLASFRGVSAPVSVDAWVPVASFPLNRAQFDSVSDAAGPDVFLVGRLGKTATLDQARAEMAVIDTRLRATAAKDPRFRTPIQVNVARGYLSREARRSVTPTATLLVGVVVIILLIACVNVANLLLSRSAVRRHEMAVRRSLGATRARLIQQGLTEGVVLAGFGAALGLLLGYWTNRALELWLPSAFPEAALRTVFLEINWRVAAMIAGVALLSAVLFSLSPAIENARSGLQQEMGRRTSRRRDLYAIAQVALSLVLLVSAGLLLRALQRTSTLDPGFATDRRMYVRLFTPEPDFTPETSTRLFSRLVEEARTIPGVHDATLSFTILGFGDRDCASTGPNEVPRKLGINVVEPNYFRMMDVPLLRGRNFSTSDVPGGRRAVILNETAARRWFPDQDAVGKRIWFGCDPAHQREEGEVIGIARDSKYMSLDEEASPVYYTYARQYWWNGFFALIVETNGDPLETAPALLRLVRSGGPKLRVYEVNTLDGVVALSLWHTRFSATVLSALSGLALALATIGLYGVMAFSVAQRTREIGIRMALGAKPLDVQWMVLGRGLRLTAVGVLLGLLLSAATAQLLRPYLHGLSPVDPVAFTAASLGWIIIAMLACYWPSLRATRVEPTVALRYE